jgi:hypothetical protein
VLADLLAERGEQLRTLEARLRVGIPGNLPPHRLLQLSADVLAGLGDLETQLHELARWLPPDGAA